MADFLSKKDWRALLKKPEHKTIKKTGVSDTLDDYASALKKKDLGKQVSSLEIIIAKAREVKNKHSKVKTLTKYLDDMITEAQKQEKRVSDQIDQLDDDAKDNPLAKDLKKLKTISDSNAWNFVVAPGRPSTGIVVRKKSILKAQIKEALAMKGKPGPFFMGKVYGGGGKIVFELEAQPPKGLAKSIKRGAKLHALIDIKVLVKGGGVEFDDDHDIEPEAEDSAPTFGGTASYPSQNDWKDEISRIGKLAPNLREPEIEGVRGRVQRLTSEIGRDTSLSDQDRDGLRRLLQAVLVALNKIDTGGSEEAATGYSYPSRQEWRELADRIVRLDADKQEQGEALFNAKTKEVASQIKKDAKTLPPKEIKEHSANLLRAAQYFLNAKSKASSLTEAMKMQDPKLQQRFLVMERNYTEVRASDLAANVDVAKVLEDFRTFRGAFRNGNAEKVNAMIKSLEKELDAAAKIVRMRAKSDAETDDQANIFETVGPQIQMVKKAAFAQDTIFDVGTIKKDIKKDGPLRTLVTDVVACEKNASPGALNKLEDSSRDYLKVCEQRRKQLGDPPDPKMVEELDKRQKVAIEALKRVRLTKIANEFETLGSPPWDSATAEKATELQAAFFFEEAAVKHGTANYQAPALGMGDAGASGSWWIERAEGTGKDKKADKKYIFKPSSREAPAFRGLPPGSGAPREVLAKKLDDFMVGVGFDVGVCPTSLVNIDSASLGGDMDPSKGLQLGSMQKLTASDGEAGPSIMLDPKVADTIDKKSYDDIAVFDMVFCNFDRHGKNVLIAKDAETGTTKLLPIDHGSALAKPDSIEMNRRALLPPDNFMADPGLSQGKQILGAESRDALKRMDPDALLKQMKKDRSDLESRHADAKGMVEDEELNAMANRVRFMQAVCDDMPVAEMFECLAYGGKRIANCKPADMPTLVRQLRAESKARAKGMEEFQEFLSAIGGSMPDVTRMLQDLGWCISISKDNIEAWVKENAALVARILKTRTENPEAQKEKNRLLALIRPTDPEIDKSIENRSLSSQLDTLMYAATPLRYSVPDDETALKQKYEQLGGDDVIEQILREWPNEDDARDVLKNKVKALMRYQELKALGGVKRFAELGGALARAEQMINVIRQIKDFEASKDLKATLESLKPEDVESSRDGAWKAARKVISDILSVLRAPGKIKEIERLRDVAIDLWDKPDMLKGQAALEKARLMAVHEYGSQTESLNTIQKNFDRFTTRLKKTKPEIQSGFKTTLDDASKRLSQANSVLDNSKANIILAELNAKLDIAEQGDEAPIKQAEVLYKSKAGAVAKHAGKQWAGQIDDYYRRAKANLDRFNAGGCTQDMGQLAKLLDTCDPLLELEPEIAKLTDKEDTDRVDEEMKGLIQQMGNFNFGPARKHRDAIADLLKEKV